MLVAQYIEFAYYGGHNRLHAASKIRLEQTRSNTMKFSVKDPLRKSWLERIGEGLAYIARLGRPARVSDDDDEEDDDEEEAAVSYYLNDEGKMVYIDDDGNEIELTEEELALLQEADREEASLAGSLEGSQVSKGTMVSQISYQSRAASRITDGSGSKSKDLEMVELGEGGMRKKLSAAERLRRKKERQRIAREAEERLVEVRGVVVHVHAPCHCGGGAASVCRQLS